MTPKVLLANTTRWGATARVAIELTKAGCDVAAVCPPHHPVSKTHAVQRVFPYGGIRPLDSLLAAIESSRPDLVIPFDDRSTEHLHALHARAHDLGPPGRALAVLIERSLGAPESYPIVSSRFELLRIAREEGLRVPNTIAVGGMWDLESWRENQPFPWVLKADGTFGGSGVKIANSWAQANEVHGLMSRMFAVGTALKRLFINRDSFWLLPGLNRRKPRIVAQTYIRGRPANCAVVCWKGTVLAGIGVDVVSAESLTGPATVVRVVENAEMMHCAERLARRLGLSGFFGLDFMIEDGSGAAFLIEMNPRCTPLCHLRLGVGRDMIGALFSRLSDSSMPETSPVTQNDRIAYFPGAWNFESGLLESSFQDIPALEPELVAELVSPWPTQSLLFRLYTLKDRMRSRPSRKRAATFTSGTVITSSPDLAPKPASGSAGTCG